MKDVWCSQIQKTKRTCNTANITTNTVTIRRHPATANAVIVVRGDPTPDSTPTLDVSSSRLQLLLGLPLPYELNVFPKPFAVLRFPPGDEFIHSPVKEGRKCDQILLFFFIFSRKRRRIKNIPFQFISSIDKGYKLKFQVLFARILFRLLLLCDK